MESDIWREIESEFGRPIQVLVEDWRENSTFRTISAAIGICEKTLRRWRKEWGMPIGADRKTDEFSRPVSKVDRKAKKLGFDDAADLIRYYKLPPRNLVDWQIATPQLLDCSLMTVYRHKPVELAGIQNLSPEGREKLRQCGLVSGGRPLVTHPWRNNDSNQ